MNGMRHLTEQEYKDTKDKLNYSLRNKCLFILGYRAGFRISELLSIRIKDIYNPDTNAISSTIKVARRNMKGKSCSREVSIHSEASQAIHEYLMSLDHIDIETPLFQSRIGNNKPLDRRMAWCILKDAFKKANITGSVATHSMRKSFAFNIYKKLDNNLLKTSFALGHSSIMTTIKYLPIDQDEINNAILNS